MTAFSARPQLEQGAAELGIPLDEDKLDQLCKYLQLLKKWNQAYNLTAVREEREMVPLHLLDSMTILPYMRGQNFIDVGAGAGLPGIVLAICQPKWSLTLLDSNGKKTRFMEQVKAELEIGNIQVVQSRAQDYQPNQKFDGVISRAFASLKDMTDNAVHLVAANGRFWAMKGQHPQKEIEELHSTYRLESCQSLRIPEITAERHLIELSLSRENVD